MEIIIDGYNVELDEASDNCSGYDTPGCGSYCNCLCNGDR